MDSLVQDTAAPVPEAVAEPLDLRTRLRRDTRAAHERVDDAFSRLDLATRDGLARFLLAHEQAFRLIEPVRDLPSMRPHLLADLARLNVAPLPPLEASAHSAHAAHPLGTAYVVAGAHYGAAVLRRRVLASPDARVAGTLGYLGSTAMKTAWRPLVTTLQSFDPDGCEADAIVEGARSTFDLFARALDAARAQPIRPRDPA